MGRVTNTEQFIIKAQSIHLNQYDYSLVNYISSRDKVIIICNTCYNKFEQTPEHHLSKEKRGCKYCAYKKQKHTQKSFIDIAKNKYPNFDYSNTIFIDMQTEITITCEKGHIFNICPKQHLRKGGCMSCNNRDVKQHTTESFIKAAKEIHNDKYDYSLVKYINNNIKVTIICKDHTFEQIPRSHLEGKGCKSCNLKSGFKRSSFIKNSIKNSINNKSIFYIIKCFNKNEEFYKIGITNRTIKQRYPDKKAMPYTYEIIKEVKGEAAFIWDLENKLKRNLNSKYFPIIKFPGCVQECYSDFNEINSYFN